MLLIVDIFTISMSVYFKPSILKIPTHWIRYHPCSQQFFSTSKAQVTSKWMLIVNVFDRFVELVSFRMAFLGSRESPKTQERTI